ncbi:MAG: GntR family transcriptional regulator [Deltaproteobacteria bacterium]|nr:GntR family transcriptional regulator [Deltaproteobacteria bacterium]
MEYLNITQTTVNHLRDQIITGVLEGGRRLNEQQLSTELGISRPPLRESFRILEYEKMVQSIPRKGTYVTEMSVEDYKRVYEARTMIELHAVELLAAKNITDLPDVEKSVEQVSSLAPPQDFDPGGQALGYFKALSTFHVSLVQSANNPYLVHFYHSMNSNLNRYLYLYYSRKENLPSSEQSEHRDILFLLKAGRHQETIDYLKRHFDSQQAWMLERLPKWL